MRAPTDDDRVLYEALIESCTKLTAATLAKGREARDVVRAARSGVVSETLLVLLDEWERLTTLELEERARVEAIAGAILR